MVAPLGFEPRQAAPEAAVLPLHNRAKRNSNKMVRKEGFEPSSLAAHAPQTCAYASSATSANFTAPLGLEPRQTDPESVVLPITPQGNTHKIFHQNSSP